MEWISVEDRLPDEGEVVSVYEALTKEVYTGKLVTNYTHYCKYCNRGIEGKEVTIWDTPIAEDFSDVTHWMPLPEPPEKG